MGAQTIADRVEGFQLLLMHEIDKHTMVGDWDDTWSELKFVEHTMTAAKWIDAQVTAYAKGFGGKKERITVAAAQGLWHNLSTESSVLWADRYPDPATREQVTVDGMLDRLRHFAPRIAYRRIIAVIHDPKATR